MSHFGFSLLPLCISVGIITILILMIPLSIDGIQITIKSDKNIPNKASKLPAKKKMRANDERTMITVDLKYEKTVAALKEAIEKETGIPREQQLLRHNSLFGELLEDEETLKNGGLGKAEVFLSFGELKIWLKYGREISTIRVDKTDTVATLKKTIKERFGIPPEKQVLIDSRDRVFKNDGKTMDDYGLKKQQNVIVIWNEFELSVKYDEIEEPFTVQVKYNDNFKSVKDKIKEKFGIPHEKQKLSRWCAKYQIEEKINCFDWRPIYDCDYIAKGDTIFVSNPFKINVKYTLNDSYNFGNVEVKGKDTVKILKEKIKAMIKEKFAVKYEDGRLRKMEFKDLNGKILDEDDKTMDDYDIKEGNTIYVNLIYWF